MRPSITRLAAFPLILAGLSGAAGLAHQLLWVRRMVDVLGAGSGTFARVVGAFFLGLSAGAWFAAGWRTSRPWRAVACAELMVAVLALAVVLLGPWLLIGQQHGLVGRLFPWVIPLLLVAPPAAAMGMVMPWMIRAVGGTRSVLLYAVNTLGGIAGLLIVIVWALPALGLNGASLLAVLLSAVVGGGAWAMQLPEPDAAAVDLMRTGGVAPGVKVAAFSSGFLVLAAEVIMQHQFAQILVSSYFSSALVLALVLVALGGGALLEPVISRVGRNVLALSLSLAALACALQPFIFVTRRGGLGYLAYQKPLAEYLWNALMHGLPACVLVLLPAGLVFPLVLRHAAERRTEVGRLFAINGIGGWCGAEMAERMIAPTQGLWWSMALLAAGYAGCILFQQGSWRWWLAPVLSVVIAWSWKIDSRLPFAAVAPGEKLVAVSLGREGVVGVVRGEPDDTRMIFNNHYTLGGSRARFNQERQTLLPMLLHGHARRVATLGVATGSSLAGATLDPELELAEGIELSAIVLRFAHDYFSPYNRAVCHHPKVRLTQGDARVVITRRRDQFDVIAGDLFLPWRTGEGRLFTREHFANVRAALRPGGLFCQWLPMFQLTREQFDGIARTFREVFPEAWLLRGDFYAEMPILGVVGGREMSALDWDAINAACTRVRGAGETRDPLMRHPEGVGMCVVGPLPVPPAGLVNTLANSWLEWDAARNLIGLQKPWFVGVPYATYLRDAGRDAAMQFPEDLRGAHEAAIWFHALEIAGAAKLPQAMSLGAEARSHLPAPLRADPGVSWREWPMKYRPALP